MDWPCMITSKLEGLLAIARDQNGITSSSEKVGKQVSDGRFVLRQQDRLRAAPRSGFVDTRFGCLAGLLDYRQVDLECRTKSRVAVHGDVATALFHKAVHGGH